MSWDEVCSPEKVLAQYHLAGSFRGPALFLIAETHSKFKPSFPPTSPRSGGCVSAASAMPVLHGLMFDKDMLFDQVLLFLA